MIYRFLPSGGDPGPKYPCPRACAHAGVGHGGRGIRADLFVPEVLHNDVLTHLVRVQFLSLLPSLPLSQFLWIRWMNSRRVFSSTFHNADLAFRSTRKIQCTQIQHCQKDRQNHLHELGGHLDAI